MSIAAGAKDLLMIESLRKGDEQSFAYFFDLHYKSLCYFAFTITQDQQQGEDIVSECFLKLWNSRLDFYTPQKIKAFLYISCKNACLNYLRNNKRKNSKQQLYLQQLEHSEDSILYQIVETEVLAILSQEIEELPTKCREVFKLLYFQHKKTDEIAELLGISAKTVRGHKARAIELLKAQLLKKGLSVAVMLSVLFFLDNH
jgi:RNA polymerase sigma-70 factor (ECF subfamily)